MFRRISETFTATHLTIMFVAALFVPGAVYATVATTAVSITDPNTGVKSFVDAARRLSVYDATAGFRNNPANIVEIAVQNSGTACESNQEYTVPAGKAFIATAISGFVEAAQTGNSGYFLSNSATCTGNALESSETYTQTEASAPISVDLGGGIIFKAGTKVSVYSLNDAGFMYIHGYLVPAGAVPAANSAEAAIEPKPLQAATVAAAMIKTLHH